MRGTEIKHRATTTTPRQHRRFQELDHPSSSSSSTTTSSSTVPTNSLLLLLCEQDGTFSVRKRKSDGFGSGGTITPACHYHRGGEGAVAVESSSLNSSFGSIGTSSGGTCSGTTTTSTHTARDSTTSSTTIPIGIVLPIASATASSSSSSSSRFRISMKDPWLFRTIRIGCVLVLISYAWLSFGDNTVTSVVELDVKGSLHHLKKVSSSSPYYFDDEQQQQRKQQQQQQQARQMSTSEDYRYHPHHQVPNQQEYSNQKQVSTESPSKEQQRAQQVVEDTPTTERAPTATGGGNNNNNDECGLYLAPSTISGGGIGIFSAYHRAKGEFVGNEEVVLPLVEVNFRNGKKSDLFNPFIHYYWKGKEKALHNIVTENRSGEVLALVPGMEAAINCNLALINVDMAGSKYDDGNLMRYKDPMAGGMSPYHSTASQVTRDIPAGGEIFKF